MAESTVVACPNCGKKYKIGADKLGRTFKCTGCETRFAAGAEAEAVAPPVEAPIETPPVQAPVRKKVAPAKAPPPPVESSDEGSDESSESPATTVDYSDGGTAKPKTSGMAIASLVFGLLGCIPGAQLLAILFGFLGLGKIKKGLARGKGLAITGIVLGVLGILAYAAAVPAALKLRHATLSVVSGINMHQIYMGIVQYQGKNDQHYPPNLAEVWKADSTLTGKDFVSPLSKDTPAGTPDQVDAPGHSSYGYIYPGPDATSVGADDVLLYEKWTDVNDDVYVTFGDGHSKTVKATEAQMLIGATGKHKMVVPMMPTTVPPTIPTPPAQ